MFTFVIFRFVSHNFRVSPPRGKISIHALFFGWNTYVFFFFFFIFFSMVLVKKEEKYIYIRKDEGLETQNRPRKKKKKKKKIMMHLRVIYVTPFFPVFLVGGAKIGQCNFNYACRRVYFTSTMRKLKSIYEKLWREFHVSANNV